MIESVIAVLREVSRTEIMPRFRHLAPADIRQKTGPQDMVTIADEAAERALEKGLRALFPGDDVIGEEAVSKDFSRLSRLKQPGRVWVLDPIDGTANFTSDLPLFGVMAALIEADEVLAGFIHDPVGDDTAVAIAGAGAWMIDREGSRRRLHVAPAVPVEEMVASLSWRYLAEPLQSRVLHRLSRVAASPDYRCAAHQYRMLAGGHAHAMSFGRLYPWDHAAGFLLHREAGGYARQFDGGEYKPSVIDGGLLLTPDEASWHALAEAILR